MFATLLTDLLATIRSTWTGPILPPGPDCVTVGLVPFDAPQLTASWTGAILGPPAGNVGNGLFSQGVLLSDAFEITLSRCWNVDECCPTIDATSLLQDRAALETGLRRVSYTLDSCAKLVLTGIRLIEPSGGMVGLVADLVYYDG